MKRILLVLITLAVYAPSFAQKVAQGKIRYEFKMSGEGVEQMEAFMPTAIEILFNKSGTITRIKGGMMEAMMGDILVNKSGSYMIKHSEKTVYEVDTKEAEKAAGTPKAEKEDEVIEILGYKCQKYKLTTNTEEGEVITYVWVTDAISLPQSASGMASTLKVADVPGIALKTMSTAMGFSTVLTATEVSTAKQDSKLFKLPKGYEKKKFDESALGGMGM